jgi:hypothetical protein
MDKVRTFLLIDGSTKEAHDPDFLKISNKSGRQAQNTERTNTNNKIGRPEFVIHLVNHGTIIGRKTYHGT